MPLLKCVKSVLLVVVFGVVACSDKPPVAPEPAGKAACVLCEFLGDDSYTIADGEDAGTEAEADSTAVGDGTDGGTDGVAFADANLERVVREAVGKQDGPITTDDLAKLRRLDAEKQNIINLAGLEHATALDTLNLWGNDLADVRPLSSLATLTFLNLGNNQVVDVSPLSSLTDLKWLNLWGNDLADVSPLSGLTNLRYLNLENNLIADVRALDSLTDLNWLGLRNNLIGASELAKQVPTLIEKKVNVAVSAVARPEPEPEPEPEPVSLFADANLERVVREAVGKPQGPLTASDLASLTELQAQKQNIESLAGLERATALQKLWLRDNPVVDVKALSGLPNLQELYLRGTGITDAGVASLSGLPNLQKLWLNRTDITDAGLASLSGLPNLQQLHLGFTGITDAGLASLSGLPNLRRLYLQGTGITDVSPLLSLTNLRELHLQDVTTLSDASKNTHIPALRANGVEVRLE